MSAIEFLGPVLLAAAGVRTGRNLFAFLAAFAGVALLANARLVGEPLGFAFAAANCVLFMLYVMLGHRIAAHGGAAGIHRLGAAMAVAVVFVSPIGVDSVVAIVDEPILLAAGLGVGVCSSVIPYICDQLAMARLSRSSFALMLTILPATAVVIGIVVLAQIPTVIEDIGVALVIVGVAVHRNHTRPESTSIGND